VNALKSTLLPSHDESRTTAAGIPTILGQLEGARPQMLTKGVPLVITA